MKPLKRFALFLVHCLMLSLAARATIVGTGLVEQPTYLGMASQPDRIPLAPVVVNSNHGFGSTGVIFESRPCYHGHFLDRGIPGYEQNLAALFGIRAEFSDPTQLPGTTLTFHLRECRPPANAAYTQEQVLAASLQCLLSSARGLREKAALTVTIQGDGIQTPEWAAKYSKPYYSEEKSADEEFEPILLPGLRIEETSLGARYIVFESARADQNVTKREPVFIPFLPEGEFESESVSLVPVWTGDTWFEPLNVLILPYLAYYERWHSGSTGRSTESVAIPHLTPPNPIFRHAGFDVNRTGKGVRIVLHTRDLSPHELAVFIFACVVSERPTLEHPMTIMIPPDALSEEYRMRLRADDSWQDGLSCDFALDPIGVKLIKGSVPGYVLKVSHGQLLVERIEGEQPSRAEDSLPSWITDAVTYIRDKAPAADRDELAEIKRDPEALRQFLPPDANEQREAMIRALLVLWKHDDSPALLENAWFAGNDRAVRAIAAVTACAKQIPGGGNRERAFDIEDLSRRFEPWEAGQRNEESHYGVASEIQKALNEWEARIAGN
jgi:hypothetical protein